MIYIAKKWLIFYETSQKFQATGGEPPTVMRLMIHEFICSMVRKMPPVYTKQILTSRYYRSTRKHRKTLKISGRGAF